MPLAAKRLSEDHEAVARALAAGAVVGFPTETVYGIGASVRQADAAARIFELKSRPADLPLMLHVSSLDAFDAFAREVPEVARQLAEQFWPGPLTLIVPAQASIDRRILGGGNTVALRAPDHERSAALVDALGRLEGGCAAIAGTSGNRHAHLPATRAHEMCAQFGSSEVPWVLEGGACALGVESTVLRIERAGSGSTRLQILRQGAISREALEAEAAPWLDAEISSAEVQRKGTGRLRALELAAIARLRPTGSDAVFAPAATLVALGPTVGLQREMPMDPGSLASVLYASLRALESEVDGLVYVALPPSDSKGVALALRSRLLRLSGAD